MCADIDEEVKTKPPDVHNHIHVSGEKPLELNLDPGGRLKPNHINEGVKGTDRFRTEQCVLLRRSCPGSRCSSQGTSCSILIYFFQLTHILCAACTCHLTAPRRSAHRSGDPADRLQFLSPQIAAVESAVASDHME